MSARGNVLAARGSVWRPVVARISWQRLLLLLFVAAFFAYLFGPLIIMTVTAFNSADYPRVTPWDCFTTQWFGRFGRDSLLLAGLANSFFIGLGVVLLSLPIGLAAAIALSEVGERARSLLYTVFIVPILLPGIVIGIATLLFWGRIAGSFGLGHDTLLYNGIFLTILGQVCFISSYSMLIFLARIQRFDPTQTEAALDLGATPGQAFRKVLLPFLKPAIGSAAVLAFLASVENYNTTVFTIVSESTFTTVLASKVRFGIDPTISAIAVIIITTTLVAAIIQEARQRRLAARRREALAGVAAGAGAAAVMAGPTGRLLSHPASVAVLLLAVVGGLVWAGSRYDSSACQDALLQQKLQRQQELLEQQRQRMQQQAPAQPAPVPSGAAPKPASPFGGVFAPNNLGLSAPGGAVPAPAPPGAAPKPASPFGNAFAPDNLGLSAPGGATAPKIEPGAPAAPADPAPATQ
ncbi:spermidine/putrescine transport system permease protein [Tistlia consotensis]|uniref:Spermidine/putrescine transport system permease protein n=1 Tax=Tistlia consotensis USBA 355 TaxID=560819 RepID=A0A1Y6BJQ3_9PROT|nr:ABC transporter permease [Tistlia consotensis]SMF13193.1 spermidine/putrescine transport system permease protein [Tistlia consotensis USBA 355]SNR50672.1 spermidine/putrescine transport system permease protein [Tistlia consotensis]